MRRRATSTASSSSPLTAAAPDAETTAALRAALVGWFRRGHRDMPWRRTRDPYAIWVSEIMLQQTRVDTVRAYYERWMARFPTVRALAEAPLDDVLARWSGLGYYARARNLKAAAERLVAEDGGAVPRDPARLRELPGVGPYTAGAIASIAFGLPAPILDGNVARVLCRVFAIDAVPDAPATRARLWAIAAALVPADAASHFNQAMMELGATVCTPREPACASCPIAVQCRARAEGRAQALPRAKVRRAAPTVDRLALVAVRTRRRAVLLARRPARGLWGGLWEPPCVAGPAREDAVVAARRAARRFGLSLTAPRALPTFTHELTHRRYRFRAVAAAATGAPRDPDGLYAELRWIAPRDLDGLGLAAWARRLLDETLRPR